jgi:hypothetical protein
MKNISQSNKFECLALKHEYPLGTSSNEMSVEEHGEDADELRPLKHFSSSPASTNSKAKMTTQGNIKAYIK